MRWIASHRAPAAPEPSPLPRTGDSLSAYEALSALPTQLNGSNLPNGVVELLIEDLQAPTRQLLDIHDGHITLVEPGTCVPWASIAGPATAWTMALGSERDISTLRLTGDEQLARRVLAELARDD
jgi:hypothetical protein